MTVSSVVLVLFSLVAALPVKAQHRVTGLDELVALVLQRNPRLQAEQLEAEALSRRAAAAGVLPNPTLGFELKNVGWGRLTVGEEMMSGFGVSVNQGIPFPGELKLHRVAARIEADQQALLQEETRLALVRQAKELYSRLFYYQRSRQLLEKRKSLLEEGARLAEARYAVGQAIQSDLFKAQVEISQTAEMILETEAILEGLRGRVASLFSVPVDSLEVIAGELPVSSLPLDAPELLARAQEKNPRLRRTELQAEKAAVEENLARINFLPDFMIRAGRMFRGRFGDVYEAMVGVEIPLYFWKREKNLLAEAKLRQQGATLQTLDLRNEIAAALHESWVAGKSAEARIALYRQRTIPQAESSLQATLSSYMVGRADFLSLLSDIDALITYQMEYAKSLADLWIAAAQVEELTGAEILTAKK
ncbi:MAG: TolC family protein [bacterium]|jgi:outer membrane protein TolC|nr:TolC family protein [candidate division KSB1 bacterium]MDH7559501.1 TolC family protein [bacterium]